MITTRNPFKAREWVFERLREIDRVGAKDEHRQAYLSLAAEIDAAIGMALATGEDAQVAAYESAREYLWDKLADG